MIITDVDRSIFSTDMVGELSPPHRGCLFSDERKLDYFDKYSQSNCYVEELAKGIQRRCGYFSIQPSSAFLTLPRRLI